LRLLADAQQLGYAEADPTFDVEGIDAAQKLVILSALAFGLSLDADRCFTEGISNIKVDDIHFADLLGYQIKHLGIAKRHGDQIELRVHPTLVSNSQLIANVNGVMNAVQVRGDSVGETLYYGAGAGAEPTASAVIADIVEAAKNISVGAIKTYACGTSNAAIMPIEESESAWYMRIPVVNQSGVLLEITGALSAQSISVHAIQQPETSSKLAQVVLTTNKVKQAVLDAAVEKIKTLDIVDGEIVTIRLEQFS